MESQESTRAIKPSRKQQILESLAIMLEASPGERITTAGLAKTVGVSEAALYRHFPSKAKMFEGLIDFVEESIFSRISMIDTNGATVADKCYQTLYLLLSFCEKNPGITRILTGDPLTGENERLRKRVSQLFNRIETQLKQFMREAALREEIILAVDTSVAAQLLMSVSTGKICQYVREDFNCNPTRHWDDQWNLLKVSLFGP